MTDQNKLLQYLFLNLVYLLKESKETIILEAPQYSDANLGFAITMFRIDPEGYNYAEKCFDALGKHIIRECGVTMSVNFNTPEENDEFRDNFKMRVDQAEEDLGKIGTLTPDEYYFLKCAPVIVGTEDGQSNHYVFIQATLQDDLDREMCRKILGDSTIDSKNGTEKITVSCYRKKWRNRLVRSLKGIGVEEIYP